MEERFRGLKKFTSEMYCCKAFSRTILFWEEWVADCLLSDIGLAIILLLARETGSFQSAVLPFFF